MEDGGRGRSMRPARGSPLHRRVYDRGLESLWEDRPRHSLRGDRAGSVDLLRLPHASFFSEA